MPPMKAQNEDVVLHLIQGWWWAAAGETPQPLMAAEIARRMVNLMIILPDKSLYLLAIEQLTPEVVGIVRDLHRRGWIQASDDGVAVFRYLGPDA